MRPEQSSSSASSVVTRITLSSSSASSVVTRRTLSSSPAGPYHTWLWAQLSPEHWAPHLQAQSFSDWSYVLANCMRREPVELYIRSWTSPEFHTSIGRHWRNMPHQKLPACNDQRIASRQEELQRDSWTWMQYIRRGYVPWSFRR